MTEKDISNVSYTNKDYRTIFPEILDMTKQLTDKWTPSESNESDPGVVLLKIAALLADKNNYNIDKNILEAFPLSVTQVANARKLYDLLGYRMHWYRSATGYITLKWTGDESLTSLKLSKFTNITDSSNSINYVTVEDGVLYPSAKINTTSINVIEGTLIDYKINDTTFIKLSDLDENNRLYFSDKTIAENGIFISTNDTDSEIGVYDWVRVDNLSTYKISTSSKYFELGVLPNSDVCYIQFPENVASLFKSSISIKYILSSGDKGNIAASKLDTLAEQISLDTDTLINDYLTILQPASTDGGVNPEGIDEAYINFKRTIGTFNTLVSTEDYADYIRNVEQNHDYIISNIVASDRVTDPNKSLNIMTWTPMGDRLKTIIDSTAHANLMKPYDLILYILKRSSTYEDSFIPTATNDVRDILTSQDGVISDIKSIQHDIHYFNDGFATNNEKDICGLTFKKLIVNLYSLQGQLIPYYKLTDAEVKIVEKNVIEKLKEKYNARNIEFGEEPNYAEIVEVIKSADDRIRDVALNIPRYKMNAVIGNVQTPFNDDYVEEKINLIARMVLSGNVQLFKIDNSFYEDIGMKNFTRQEIIDTTQTPSTYKYIQSISTSTTLTLAASSSEIIGANKVIQLKSPSYVEKINYTNGVEYRTTNISSLEEDKKTLLTSGQFLTVRYKDENNVLQTYTYESGDIIKVNFAYSGGAESDYESLSSSQVLTIYEENKSILNAGTEFYFIDTNNNSENINFELTQQVGSSLYTKTLNQGEYLIYKGSSEAELIYLGSGTELESTSSNQYTFKNISTDSLFDGVNADIEWATILNNITAKEQEIINIPAGKTVLNETSTSQSFTSSWVALSTAIKVDNVSYHYYLSSNPYQARILLNLNSNTTEPMALETGDTITLKLRNNNGSTPVISSSLRTLTIQGGINCYVVFNSPVLLTGGTDIDVIVLNEDTLTYSYSLQCATYTQDNNFQLQDILSKRRLANGYYKVDLGIIADTYIDLPISFNDINGSDDSTSWILPLLLSSATATTTSATTIFEIEGLGDSYTLYTSWSASVTADTTVNPSHTYYIQSGAGTSADPYVYTKVSNPTGNPHDLGYYEITGIDITTAIYYKRIGSGTSQDPYIYNRIFGDVIETSNVYTQGHSILSGNYLQLIGGDATNIIELTTDSRISNTLKILNSAVTGLRIRHKTTNKDILSLGLQSKFDGYNNDEIDVELNGNDIQSLNYLTQDEFKLSNNYTIGVTTKSGAQWILTKMNSLDTAHDFNWSHIVSSTNKVLQPTASANYWNKNHLYNKITIGKIDFNTTSIKVNAQFKK